MLAIEIIRFEAQDIVTASCICNESCLIYQNGSEQHPGCLGHCQALQHVNAGYGGVSAEQ